MSQNHAAKCIIPGFGESETVPECINTLLDFAQFYDFPQYHSLAQSLAALENRVGNVPCIEIPEETQEFLLDLQGDILLHAHKLINTSDAFGKSTLAIAAKIQKSPDVPACKSTVTTVNMVSESFETLFLEEIEDYFWHHRIVAKIIWKFDNWFGDKISELYRYLCSEMVDEVDYWKMARQVSFLRAIA